MNDKEDRVILVNIASFKPNEINVSLLFKPTLELYTHVDNGCYLDAWISLFEDISGITDELMSLRRQISQQYRVSCDYDAADKSVRDMITEYVNDKCNNSGDHFSVKLYQADQPVPHTFHNIWLDLSDEVIDTGGLGMVTSFGRIPSDGITALPDNSTVYKSAYNWDSIEFTDLSSIVDEMHDMYPVVPSDGILYVIFKNGNHVCVDRFFDQWDFTTQYIDNVLSSLKEEG